MIDSTSWMTVYPEIVLLVMACVIALVDLLVTSPKRTVTYVLTLVSLGGVALLHAFYADAGHTLYGVGGVRPHGALAQVFCHHRCHGDLGLRTPLCGRSRHVARR